MWVLCKQSCGPETGPHLAVFHESVSVVLFGEEERQDFLASLSGGVPQRHAAVVVAAARRSAAVQQQFYYHQMALARRQVQRCPPALHTVSRLKNNDAPQLGQTLLLVATFNIVRCGASTWLCNPVSLFSVDSFFPKFFRWSQQEVYEETTRFLLNRNYFQRTEFTSMQIRNTLNYQTCKKCVITVRQKDSVKERTRKKNKNETLTRSSASMSAPWPSSSSASWWCP